MGPAPGTGNVRQSAETIGVLERDTVINVMAEYVTAGCHEYL